VSESLSLSPPSLCVNSDSIEESLNFNDTTSKSAVGLNVNVSPSPSSESEHMNQSLVVVSPDSVSESKTNSIHIPQLTISLPQIPQRPELPQRPEPFLLLLGSVLAVAAALVAAIAWFFSRGHADKKERDREMDRVECAMLLRMEEQV